jgi:NAD(P)-dependent dehydrogenase (short-subunit alcohol dehydrogenase family)
MSSSKGTLLLTGANGGIATGFVAQFLRSPFASSIKGYYGVRDPAKADSIRTTLKNHVPHDHDYEIATLDFSSLESVREAAKKINQQVASGSLPPIRALVLNAGTQVCLFPIKRIICTREPRVLRKLS